MSYFDTENAVFNEQLRKLKDTDPAHADTFNAEFELLIKNDVVLKKEQDENKISMSFDAKSGILKFFRGGVKLLELSASSTDDGSYELLIDSTLSMAGAAADAESVGKEISNILEILAGKVQLAPEFANDVSECIDTTKLYVLPDGEIYAYRKYVGPLYTNRANPESADWLTDTRLSTSGTSALSGTTVTNIISAKNGDVIRIKGLDVYSLLSNNSRPRIHCISGGSINNRELYPYWLIKHGYGTVENDVYTITEVRAIDENYEITDDKIVFDQIRFCGTVVGAVEDVIITVNEEIAEDITYKWESTGLAFVPADYEDRIIALEKAAEQINKGLASMGTRVEKLESENVSTMPDYYTSHLEEKVDLINQVLEKAGRNKSSFLGYADAHWTAGSSKMSPLILTYLYENTALNKTIFLGDIVGDPTELTHEYLKDIYVWRKLVKFIGQHSVLGNHDNLHKGRNDSEISDVVYSFLIAPEETPDMVIGGDFNYYIDDVCEKTRYLYLDSGRFSLSDDETKFIIDALTSTKDGWHIVVASHIWFQYTSASAPTVGSINGYMQKVLDLFDAYNSRETGSITMMNIAHTYDFRLSGGKVEFCVGGHIHVSHVLYSAGGIPVVLLPSDVNQNRSSDHTEDCGTIGTITEVAVGALIADYDNNILTIVGVGRMQDRIIDL